MFAKGKGKIGHPGVAKANMVAAKANIAAAKANAVAAKANQVVLAAVAKGHGKVAKAIVGKAARANVVAANAVANANNANIVAAMANTGAKVRIYTQEEMRYRISKAKAKRR
jgi:hypothetical protein